MKNHLNMTMTSISGNNGASTGVINNMTLQALLATKDEAQVAEFERSTGWSWLSACTTALEADPNLTIETDEARFERETGWTFGDAVDMAAEARRDDRLFGRSHRFGNRNSRAKNLSFADKFARETGWNLGDAIDMAADRRREVRLFGTRH